MRPSLTICFVFLWYMSLLVDPIAGKSFFSMMLSYSFRSSNATLIKVCTAELHSVLVKQQEKPRMKSRSLCLLLVLMTVACMLATNKMNLMDHMDRIEMENVKSTLGYSGSGIDNHHSITRQQYDSHGGGSTGQQSSYGDKGSNQGSGGGGVN